MLPPRKLLYTLLLLSISVPALAINASDSNVTHWPSSWQVADIDNACNWEGIYCALGSVQKIALHAPTATIDNPNPAENCMLGQLPDTFHNFPNLMQFDIRITRLYGTIPPSLISTHPTLMVLQLFDSYIVGTIPEILSPHLRILEVRDNLMSGTIPTSVLNIAETLNLGSNQFECPFPNIGHLFNLSRTCSLSRNRFTVDSNGKYCGVLSPTDTACILGPQIPELIPVPPLLTSEAFLEINSSQIIARVLRDEGYIAFYVRDKDTGIFIEDQYFIVQVVHMRSELIDRRPNPGRFTGFTSQYRKVGDGQYEIDGAFETGLTITIILAVAEDKSSIKLGWKINANAKPVQTPILSMSLFLKAPLHEGSAGYPCIERDFELNLLTPEDFENGYPFINCRGSYTNFTAIIQDPVDQPYFEYRFESARFDISFIWESNIIVDGNQVPFRTRRSEYFVSGARQAYKAHRAQEFGLPGFVAILPHDQWIQALYPLQYPDFTDSVFYDPEIRVNDLFALTPDPDGSNVGAIAGAVVGSVVGVGIIAFVATAIASPKARAKMLPFTNRKPDSPATLNDGETHQKWKRGNGANVPLKNSEL